MKKKLFIILLIMVLWPLVVMAEDSGFNATVTVQQNQIQLQSGGKGKGDTRIRSFINPYMDTEFLPPPATYPPGKVVAYTEEKEIPYWKLDHLPLKDLLKKYRQEGDIIQYEKKLISLEPNKRNIRLLPGRLTEPPLWTVCLESTTNGFVREAVRRAGSLAKAGTNVDRAFIQIETCLNPWTAGNALSFGGASSFLPGTSALAVGTQPQIGKSESRVYPVYRVTVYCYRPGPVPMATRQKANQSHSKLFLFKGEKLANREVVNYNAAWLAERFNQIKKKNFKIKILGQGKEAEEITRIAVYALGNELIKRGLSTQEVIQILEGIPMSTAIPRLKPPIKGVTGVVWLKISR